MKARGRVFEAFDDLFAVLQLAFFDPRGHLRDAFGIAVGELIDEKAFGARLFREQVDQDAEAGLRLLRVVLRDLSADGNAGSWDSARGRRRR